jgi:hypothetical protein
MNSKIIIIDSSTPESPHLFLPFYISDKIFMGLSTMHPRSSLLLFGTLETKVPRVDLALPSYLAYLHFSSFLLTGSAMLRVLGVMFARNGW